MFDVGASEALTDEQKRRIIARARPAVVAVAQDERSQARNRELALERLAQRLAGALTVRRPRRATRPSRASVKRRLPGRPSASAPSASATAPVAPTARTA